MVLPIGILAFYLGEIDKVSKLYVLTLCIWQTGKEIQVKFM